MDRMTCGIAGCMRKNLFETLKNVSIRPPKLYHEGGKQS
jgi:hypothetical protein